MSPPLIQLATSSLCSEIAHVQMKPGKMKAMMTPKLLRDAPFMSQP
jgi:hypothetical protein